MQQKNIHWFPGHMQKATKEINEKLKIIDVIIELLDARAPLASRNEVLLNLTKNKKRLVVLTKCDLADDKMTRLWIEYFKKQGVFVATLDQSNKKLLESLKISIGELGTEKQEKLMKKGMKPQPIRAMIVGIPNVGKSTLINRISQRRAASVQNTPGHTKAQQWIKVNKDFELLDTPGILPPNYSNPTNAINLALLGSIKETILPLDELGDKLLDFLKGNYADFLKARFQIEFENDEENYEILTKIAQRRGLITNKEFDIGRANAVVLKEFKEGLIGKISLEKPQC